MLQCWLGGGGIYASAGVVLPISLSGLYGVKVWLPFCSLRTAGSFSVVPATRLMALPLLSRLIALASAITYHRLALP